jgi:hypothetical protein
MFTSVYVTRWCGEGTRATKQRAKKANPWLFQLHKNKHLRFLVTFANKHLKAKHPGLKPSWARYRQAAHLDRVFPQEMLSYKSGTIQRTVQGLPSVRP